MMANETRSPGLIQRYRELLQTRHYARRTVKTYEQWLRRFLRFHGMRHPREMGSAEVNASTQNQALAALLFLYRELLERDLELDGVVRARIEGDAALVVGLLYGSGLRLMEALRLRVKDLDFQRRELTVRNGKGCKDRLTLLPQSMLAGLQEHLLMVRHLHQNDLTAGWGRVSLPYALARKYPNANSEWAWQWYSPSRIAGTAGNQEARGAIISIQVWCKRP